MSQKETVINQLIHNYEHPKRIAISRKYPLLKKPILFLRQTFRTIKNYADSDIKVHKNKDYYECIVARHQSLLRRNLGNSDPRLQEQKITNLKQAIKKLNGIVIKPGKIFSLWHTIGRPNYQNGYVNGMLLSGGKVIEGVGGGLCQLSNFLYWIFLHSPIQVVERYHHSMDVFPDSGRVLPFGSGATILYNFVDLKIKNTSPYPLQLKIWLTDTHLKGQILSPQNFKEKYHIFEKNHFFIKKNQKYFRYNEIYREIIKEGKTINIERITTNFAPVLYEINDNYLKENNFQVLDFTI